LAFERSERRRQKPGGDTRSRISAKYPDQGVSWPSSEASGGGRKPPEDARRGISAKYPDQGVSWLSSEASGGGSGREFPI
jgi:hypothetical protein